MQIYADANCYLWPLSSTSWSSSGQCGDRVDNVTFVALWSALWTTICGPSGQLGNREAV